MDLGLFVLRIVVGALFAGHGAQKLYGWFGGHGIKGTGQFFESLGIHPGQQNARMAGLAELAGGLLIALGLLVPVGAMLIISVMVVAIMTAHWEKGPWITQGGYEYNLVLIAIAFAIAGAGPGDWALSNLFGLDDHSTGWAIFALLAGCVGAFAIVSYGRSQKPAARTAPRRSGEPIAH
jgi:putative oxidoreductase